MRVARESEYFLFSKTRLNKADRRRDEGSKKQQLPPCDICTSNEQLSPFQISSYSKAAVKRSLLVPRIGTILFACGVGQVRAAAPHHTRHRMSLQNSKKRTRSGKQQDPQMRYNALPCHAEQRSNLLNCNHRRGKTQHKPGKNRASRRPLISGDTLYGCLKALKRARLGSDAELPPSS